MKVNLTNDMKALINALIRRKVKHIDYRLYPINHTTVKTQEITKKTNKQTKATWVVEI